MTDVIDAAQKTEELWRGQAMARSRQLQTSPGKRDCVDCGEQIEPERRAANPSAFRCIECQRISEGNA